MNSLTQNPVAEIGARRIGKRNAGNGSHQAHGGAGAAGVPWSARHGQPLPLALGRTVTREVIPRLVVAHRPASAPDGDLPGRADLIEFTDLIAGRDLEPAWALIDRRRAQGMSLESLYASLLVPAARRLSELWEADLCHYEEIAIGMLHLQQLLQGLSPAFALEGQCDNCGRRALLLSAPAERNMLGVFMITEFYRRVAAEFFHHAGWEVWRAPPTNRAHLLSILKAQWFDVIDVSASCAARLPALAADITDMRKASRNDHVGLMVGGPVFAEHPEYASRVGADALAADPRELLTQAEQLLSNLEHA